MEARPKFIVIIALWMILFPIPEILRDLKGGWDLVLNPFITVKWAYYVSLLFGAVGLLRLKSWARVWTIWLFLIHFCLLSCAIYLLMGPSLKYVLEGYGLLFQISSNLLRKGFAGAVFIYFFWLLGIIFYLGHPQIKLQFKK